MKHYFALFLLFSTVLMACKKGDKLEPTPPPPTTPPPVKPVASTKTFKIDSIRSIVQKNGFYTALSDSIWADSAGISFKVQIRDDAAEAALSFPATENTAIFPGALLQGNSIGTSSYKSFVFSGYKQNPLVIFSSSTSFDPLMTKLIPSLSGTTDFIKTSLKTDAKQISDFTYTKGTEFRNYSEITMWTRKNWDFSSLVIRKAGDKGHIKKKTGFFVNFELALFDIAVDFPASDYKIFEAGVDPASISGDPVYVNDVVYGRTAIIAIESDAAFQEINAAFQAVQTGKESAEDKKILQEAVITIYMRGFKTDEVSRIQTAQGHDRVSLFTKALLAGGTYSNTDYGVPISFYVSKITDYTSMKYKFKYRLDFSI